MCIPSSLRILPRNSSSRGEKDGAPPKARLLLLFLRGVRMLLGMQAQAAAGRESAQGGPQDPSRCFGLVLLCTSSVFAAWALDSKLFSKHLWAECFAVSRLQLFDL
jgi:hypothetical protein